MTRIAYYMVATALAVVFSQQVPVTSHESRAAAEGHIQALRTGTLAVRVPSNKKKTDYLKSKLEDADLDAKERERISQLLNETLEQTRDLHADLTGGFTREFDFCRVVFFLDFQSADRVDSTTAYLENDLATVVPPGGLPRPIYILTVGRTPESSREGLVVLAPDGESIKRPFPNNVITGGLSGLIQSWNRYQYDGHVRRLNKKLWKFYRVATD